MVDVPSKYIVYFNNDDSCYDAYSVVFPDGEVFLFEREPPHRARYLCKFRRFRPDPRDVEVFTLPLAIAAAIERKEA